MTDSNTTPLPGGAGGGLPLLSSSLIKAEAARLGFAACGIARVTPVDESTASAFNRWIADGNHADMDYMNRYGDARFHPESVLPGCRTIVSLALDYTPTHRIPANQPQFAFYAYGPDYHETMKAKIRELAEAISGHSPCFPQGGGDSSSSNPDGLSPTGEMSERQRGATSFRVAVDTAPLLERYWAQQAGIGWIGRHHNLIIPGTGSFVNLGELLLTAEVDHYDQPIPNHCGTCRKCIEACPTGALSPSPSLPRGGGDSSSSNPEGLSPSGFLSPDNGGTEGGDVRRTERGCTFDARRCLSYLTIEHRGPFTPEQAALVRNQPEPKYIYGCDRCQLACPHNRRNPSLTPPQRGRTQSNGNPPPWEGLGEVSVNLTRDQYNELFRGSAVKRAKYEGLMRNIETVLKE